MGNVSKWDQDPETFLPRTETENKPWLYWFEPEDRAQQSNGCQKADMAQPDQKQNLQGFSKHHSCCFSGCLGNNNIC